MTTKISADNLKADIAITTTGDIDVSSGTLTLANDQISGDKISGGTISTFTSTGIDDNATSTAITIDSSGDVGINISSPNLNPFAKAVTLSSGEATNCAYELAKGSTLHGALALQGDNRVQLINFQDADLTFNTGTGATERMRIDHSTGGIGIGTSSPENNLHIFTDGGTEGLTIKSTGNTANLLVSDTNRSGAGSNMFLLGAKWNGTYVADILFITGSDTTNKDDGIITFRTASSGTLSEKMRIDSSGRVGIGTSSPSSKLHVNGNFTSTGIDDNAASTAITIDSSENVGIGGTPSSTQRLIVNGDGSSIIGGVEFRNASSGGSTASIGMANATSSSLSIAVNDASNMVFKNSGGTERMRIKSDGTVRIGTSDVVGSLEVTDGIYIGGTDTANKLDDYEEGSWTPTITSSVTNPTITYDTWHHGNYTKIGDTVFARAFIRTDSVSGGSGDIYIKGFPFNFVAGSTGSVYPASVMITGMSGWSTTPSYAYNLYVDDRIQLYDSSGTPVPVSGLNTGTNGNQMMIFVMYKV